MIYLASPYSHPDPLIRKTRFLLTQDAVADLCSIGKQVYSPIVYWHPIAEKYSLQTDAEFWWEFNVAMQRRCELLYVLKLEGWDESYGVEREITLARDMNQPINYIVPAIREE